MHRSIASLTGIALLTTAALLALGLVLPKWLLFMCTMAFANGLVSLGIVLLMRGGVVAFGQGLMSAIGGYTAALMFQKLGVNDALVLTMCGGITSLLITAPFAPLLSRYRGIFFSMLTLALSMVGYGILVKTETLGGSDGFNLGRVTLLGQSLGDAWVGYVLFAISAFLACLMAYICRIYFNSTRGLITQAIRENELRVEYLGGSVRHTMAINFCIAAFLGGCGGAMVIG